MDKEALTQIRATIIATGFAQTCIAFYPHLLPEVKRNERGEPRDITEEAAVVAFAGVYGRAYKAIHHELVNGDLS